MHSEAHAATLAPKSPSPGLTGCPIEAPLNMTGSEAQELNYPMGPKVRAYLGIPEAGAAATDREPSPAETAAFVARLKAHHPVAGAHLGREAVVDLVDELVAMALPEAALDLAAARPEAFAPHDFRAQLALGVATMMAGSLDRAADHLRTAQATLPEEPAPYVNLTQILMNQGRVAEAELWCEGGLDAEPNHFALWDLRAELLRHRHGDYMPEELLALAQRRGSWAGLSLAANLITTGDRYFKAGLLEQIYHQGERDPEFLVELTGAYGIAGSFEKIPPIVWQAERFAGRAVPWQLHVHCAQAQLAVGQADLALAQLAKAGASSAVPLEGQEALRELVGEAEAAQRQQTSDLH